MPRGGPGRGGAAGRGSKKSHKGQRRHFTDSEELKLQAAEDERKKEWRRKQGIASDEEEEEAQGDQAEAKPSRVDEDSSSDSDSSDSDSAHKAKGVSHLIEIENPNRITKKTKKVSDLLEDGSEKVTLSRREREELEKQQARQNYQRLHMQGKTEEARSDLARLALIRKQREDAAKARDNEKKLKDAVKPKSDS